MYKQICITNRHLAKADLLEQIRKAAEAGADMIILREKDLSVEEYIRLAGKVIEICREYGALCILHTFIKAAQALEHPYIHLSFSDFVSLSCQDRKWFKELGVSTHTLKEALKCEALGASYITASHIFETDCKPCCEPKGLKYLEEVVKAVNIPVYALGGINNSNSDLCIQKGAKGVCMMSGWMTI